MNSPEIQSISHRSSVISSISAPTFTSFNGVSSPDLSNLPSIRTSSGGISITSLAAPSRFNPNSFSYNSRIAIALLPSAVFLLDLGGSPVAVTLTLGLIIAYILDSLDFKPGAFFAVWMTLIASQISFFFSSSLVLTFNSVPLAIIAGFLCAQTNFLVGVWASLQFKWIQIENPSIVLALERLLFACAPLVASILFTWATVFAIGMANAAYYLMVFNCVFYYIFSVPRVSSFKSKQDGGYHGGEVPQDILILGSLESCCHTLNLLFSPLLFHIASHYPTLLSSFASISDIFLLFFIPFMFQLYASTRNALWWVTKNPQSLHSIRVMNGAIALVFVVICLEFRVVFRSFGRYIQVPPPLNYLLVTITMLGGASAAGAYALGLVSSGFGYVAFMAMSLLSSTAGAVVVGFPLLFLPVPAACGFSLAQFIVKRNFSWFCQFFISGVLMFIWFVHHNFWGLDIWMADMPLESLSKLIISNFIFIIAIPGFSVLPTKLVFLTEISLVFHAAILCFIETVLLNYSNLYYFGLDDPVVYPSYMVFTTTFIGLAVVRKLAADHLVRQKWIWVSTCLYVSKLSLLFVSSKTVVWASASLLLAVSPPLLLYRNKAKTASRMTASWGYFHATVIIMSVFLFRGFVSEILQWWNGRPASDPLVLGFCFILIGLGCVPILLVHFPHALSARRWLAMVVATGFLLILMRPTLPLTWARPRPDLITTPRQWQASDDISIYGFAAPKPIWPPWLLIAAILLTLAASLSLIPVKYVPTTRLLYSISMGVSLGIYISTQYFFQSFILHSLIVLTMVSASVFFLFARFPSASSTRLLPWLFALLVALFPTTYLLEAEFRAAPAAPEDVETGTTLAVEGARTSLLGLYAAVFMLVALQVKFELASLMRRRDPGRPDPDRSAILQPKMRLLRQRKSAMVPAFAIKRMAAEGAWMPAVGNVAAVMCFAICLFLNSAITGGSGGSIFLLAPVLLLLNQDSDFVSGLGERRRYFPVTAAVSGFLVLTAFHGVWEEVRHGDPGWGPQIGGPDWLFAVKNLALIVLTLPGQILFNRFMWREVKQVQSVPLLALPLNLPPLVMSDLPKSRLLGALGILYGLVQYLFSRHQYLRGLRYI